MKYTKKKGRTVKRLLIDIETAPEIATVWGLWQQNVGINQILEDGYVLCWSAKWLDDDTMYFDSIQKSKPKQMLKRIHKLISSADAVVHYNGNQFDMPTLNREFLKHHMLPPAPVKNIDLLVTVRKQFRFPSNKLDYVAQRLGVGKKTEHQGHELWLGCMNNDPVCWAKMREYNENDVLLLEKVYKKLLPWVVQHPSISVYDGIARVCPKCGSDHLNSRGYAHTKVGKYRRYQCVDCGSWMRDSHRDESTLTIKERLTVD